MILSALLAACTMRQELPEVKMGKAQLVFLVEPENPPKVQGAADLQAAHLKRLEQLWQARKALLVGPFLGEGKRRGLLVLDVETAKEAEDILADDPWVRAGQLKFESHTWFFAKNYVLKGPKFMDLSNFWFGTLDKSPDAPQISEEEASKIQSGHMANIQKMAKEGALVLAGPILGDTSFRGVFVFKDMKKDEIEKLVAGDPAIQSGRLKLTLTKWRAPKGSFLIGDRP